MFHEIRKRVAHTHKKALSTHLLASQDLGTYTGIHEHTHRAEFHAYGAVIVCPNPSIIDYYSLIRLISYLRNRLKGQLAKTLHLVVCVGLCVFCFCIFLSVFIYATLYVFHCVCACVSVCACVCLCAPLQDISIGRPILSSLWVDFKGEEISAGFSRLVNSLSPESGVFSSCVCMGVCAYLSLLTVCVCMCLCTCTCVHVFKCIHWLPKHWLMAIKKAFTRGSISPSRCWCLYVRACVCEKMYWMQAFSCMEENMHELYVCVYTVCVKYKMIMQVIGFELNLYGIITPLSLTHKHLHAHVCIMWRCLTSKCVHLKTWMCWSQRCVCKGLCVHMWVGGWIIEVFHLSGNQFVLEISRVHECWITHHNTVGLNYGKTSCENINKVQGHVCMGVWVLSVCIHLCVFVWF